MKMMAQPPHPTPHPPVPTSSFLCQTVAHVWIEHIHTVLAPQLTEHSSQSCFLVFSRSSETNRPFSKTRVFPQPATRRLLCPVTFGDPAASCLDPAPACFRRVTAGSSDDVCSPAENEYVFILLQCTRITRVSSATARRRFHSRNTAPRQFRSVMSWPT